MRRLVVLSALAGCGRLGFDSAPTRDALADDTNDVVPLGHDEDGDGVRDIDDTCPHLAVPQTDGDGDGVGDACDPNPSIARERIALFATMQAGDQPFLLSGDGEWEQHDDALRFEGDLGVDQNLYGGLRLPITLGDVRIALGIDITAIVPGSASGQHQLAMAAADLPPLYYVELNEVVSSIDYASITNYDGSSYYPENFADLANGIHPGALFFQTTQILRKLVRLDVGWPGEMYELEVADEQYQGATRIEMNFNNVHFEIRYLIVITSS